MPYGFDDFASAHKEYLEAHGRGLGRTVDLINPPLPSILALAGSFEGDPESYYANAWAAQAIELLERYAENGRRNATPFFLRLDFAGPHFPYVAPEPYASMYNPADIPEPPQFAEAFAGKPRLLRKVADYWHTADLDWSFWQPVVAKFWGVVTLLDELVGRVVGRLEDLELLEDTYVFFTSDHGDAAGERRVIDKLYGMYDELYHIPLLAAGPGVAAEQTCEEFVMLHDLMPTFCELAGARVPQHLDGRSLQPLLRGETPDDWRDDVFAEYTAGTWGPTPARMLRTRTHKLIFNAADRDELYNLVDDPCETSNRIDDPALATVRDDLYARLVGHMKRNDDPFANYAGDLLLGRGKGGSCLY